MNRSRRFSLFSCVLFLTVVTTSNALPNLSRIVGGVTAADGAFPWQVILRSSGVFFCGGTIVTDRHVVSAAHCFSDTSSKSVNNLAVISGTNSLDNGGQAHAVAKITKHPKYIGKTDFWKYDVAVLTLRAPIAITPLQSPIPLARRDPPAGARAIVSGWGQTMDSNYNLPSRLQYFTPNIISNTKCESTLRSQVARVHICAHENRAGGVCMGDSGGPLVYDGKLVGIVSWGQRPCASLPDAYTRITLVLDFIEDVIRK
ncbi:trypsin delta-like [Athalia rosae]|uniref:trypsin delta-like n=1 Tax=Athalia rosae TaxID=37344 RepID=UPI00203378CA|nr:trypsin delta-like [Athalia rosae]